MKFTNLGGVKQCVNGRTIEISADSGILNGCAEVEWTCGTGGGRFSKPNPPTCPADVENLAYDLMTRGMAIIRINMHPDDYERYYNNLCFFPVFKINLPAGITVDDIPELKRQWYAAIAPKKCECGAEKCGMNLHSSWCPKASKP